MGIKTPTYNWATTLHEPALDGCGSPIFFPHLLRTLMEPRKPNCVTFAAFMMISNQPQATWQRCMAMVVDQLWETCWVQMDEKMP